MIKRIRSQRTLSRYLLYYAGLLIIATQCRYTTGQAQFFTAVPSTETGTEESVPTAEPTTPFPSALPTVSNMPSRSARPTGYPSIMPTNYPSVSFQPSRKPSQVPSLGPTTSKAPSLSPSFSIRPSKSPSLTPTDLPSWLPSLDPTEIPSHSPTNFPTASAQPSFQPSIAPTNSPEPSDQPSDVPTVSSAPSSSPSGTPTTSQSPSAQPSLSSRPSISVQPSFEPSSTPSSQPSVSSRPSMAPSVSHAPTASKQPSDQPSDVPSDVPSMVPTVSAFPSTEPSESPSRLPSTSPSYSPSALPSAAPTFTPTNVTRVLGMVIQGLDTWRVTNLHADQFAQLIDNHTMQFFGPQQSTNWATVVYASSTRYERAIRRPSPFWGDLRNEFLDITSAPTSAVVSQLPEIPGGTRRSSFDNTRQSTVFDIIGDNNNNNTQTDTLLPTTAPTFDFILVADDDDDNNNTTIGEHNETINITVAPSANPTVSHEPSMTPSRAPSIAPSMTITPSLNPTATYAPSHQPTSLPGVQTNQVWYEQTIVYGERFAPFNDTEGAFNDPRTTSIDEIFQLPFMIDQTRFTEELIRIINNQLPIVVEFVEVRTTESAAPSVFESPEPSDVPSAVPTGQPSPAPSVEATGGLTTTAIIVAVTVPVVVVLLIAFAGIIYVTRVDHDELLRSAPHEEESTYGEDLPVPVPFPLDPNVPPGEGGGSGVMAGGGSGAMGRGGTPGAGGAHGTSEDVNYGRPAVDPLIEPSELLAVSQHLPDTPTVGEDHPPIVTTRGRANSGNSIGMMQSVSAISEFSAHTPDDRNRRVPQGTPLGTPGYLSASGTPLPPAPPTPQRLGRAVSAGGIPSTPTERHSPFQAVRGGIPTIPTSQLGSSEASFVPSGGGSPGVTTPGGGPDDGPPAGLDDSQQQVAVSESEESDSEDDPFHLAGFNLQIQDIDDFQ
ncbi:expressed unknown protein [Seminavis robusta]|uniref:Circumsporozoite protein n=1 Tax=Seminavis robusta TaxID=568900 RepID=A0A9N8D9I9_9STRA|nr:expressed unknown protein [Seminavis robusta]|eukprot:Sro46_g027390.1 n/a (941) ;mRNA; f:53022-56040